MSHDTIAAPCHIARDAKKQQKKKRANTSTQEQASWLSVLRTRFADRGRRACAGTVKTRFGRAEEGRGGHHERCVELRVGRDELRVRAVFRTALGLQQDSDQKNVLTIEIKKPESGIAV